MNNVKLKLILGDIIKGETFDERRDNLNSVVAQILSAFKVEQSETEVVLGRVEQGDYIHSFHLSGTETQTLAQGGTLIFRLDAKKEAV